MKHQDKFETVKKIVESGESKIFNNWSESIHISKTDFLDAWEWLCDDEMIEHVCPDGHVKHLITREVVATRDGKLHKVDRCYYSDGSFKGFYKDGRIFYPQGSASLNVLDRI